MTYTSALPLTAPRQHSRAPAILAGLILALALIGLARNVDIPQPNPDWQGKVETRRGPY